ncbi:MAG: dockerin type I repeat-containing protein [Ruminococcus sp.]|nr:dockerin type I repeat-containing protein [Ruminococcus sp.]
MRAPRTAAALAASLLLLLCSDRIPADISPVVYAEDTAVSTELPEWVPDSCNAALQFFNLHGGTYIQDGLLCITFCRPNIPGADAGYTVSATEGAMEEISHELYEYTGSGMYITDTEVFVFRPAEPGSFSISLNCTADGLTPEECADYNCSYEFSVDADLNISQTDITAGLPDCPTEFKEYYDANGVVSVAGGRVVFCMPSPTSLFATWKEGYCSENMKLAGKWSCTDKRASQNTGFSGRPTTMDIAVYEPVSEGPVDIRWDIVDIYYPDSIPKSSYAASYLDTSLTTPSLSKGDARIRISDYTTGQPVIFNEDSEFSLHRRSSVTDSTTLITSLPSNPCVVPGLCSQFENTIPTLADALYFKLVPSEGYSIPKKDSTTANADDYLTVTVVNGEAYEVEFRVIPDLSGDANGDGEFSAADLVTLQKWLLGMPDAALKKWKACDLCNDNVIDAFDLCLMRQSLIEALKPPTYTVMMIDSARTHDTVRGVESYNIITDFDSDELAGMDDILALTDKLSQNAEQYADMKPEILPCAVEDYGKDTLYLIYYRPDRDPERFVLCTYGETCSCLPDDDVRKLVVLMIEKGMFAAEGAADIYR